MNKKQLAAYTKLISQVKRGTLGVDTIDLSNHRLTNDQLKPLLAALKQAPVLQRYSIRKLLLANNQLKYFTVDFLPSLNELDLANNQISKLQLDKMPLLAKLYLQNNPLEYLDPDEFSSVRKLMIDEDISQQFSLLEVSNQGLQRYCSKLLFAYLNRLPVLQTLRTIYHGLSTVGHLPKELIAKILNDYLMNDLINYMLPRFNRLLKDRTISGDEGIAVFDHFLKNEYKQLRNSLGLVITNNLEKNTNLLKLPATKNAAEPQPALAWSFANFKNMLQRKIKGDQDEKEQQHDNTFCCGRLFRL